MILPRRRDGAPWQAWPLSLLLLGAAAWSGAASAQPQDFGAAPALGTATIGNTAGLDGVTLPSVGSPGLVFGVTLGELYTDNLRVAPRGTPMTSSWITQVQPFIVAARASPRFSGVFAYTLTGYAYTAGSRKRRLAQHLDANGSLTLLPQHFFVDGSASYGRAVINNQLPFGPGTVFLEDNNLANVAMASLSPNWRQSLGGFGNLTLRYTQSRVLYNTRDLATTQPGLLNGVPNLTRKFTQFNLASPARQTWGWDLGYSDARLEPGFGTGVQFARAQLQVSRWMSNHWQLLADAGKETRFQPDGSFDTLGAPFWDAGFHWLGARNNFTLMAGHRFFGHSYAVSWSHHAALLTIQLAYSEQPTTYNQELLQSAEGLGGLPPIDFGHGIPSLTEVAPYLSKRWTGLATYSMPRGSLNLQVYDDARTFFSGQREDESQANATLAWRFDLGARTTLTPGFGWQRYAFEDGQVQFTRYGQLALSHHFNAHDVASLRVRHATGASDSTVPDAQGYRVNVVFLQWTHLL